MYSTDTLIDWHKGQGHWQSVPLSDWTDWRWQMRNRLTKKSYFSKYIQLTNEESEGLDIAQTKLSVSVTPHFFNLIDIDNPNCPIRKQVIPTIHEGVVQNCENIDPVGEESSMVSPGLGTSIP